MSDTLIVIEWERFQHYKDRDPPWIKLYRDILTSEAWVCGTDLSRLVQIAITLLAARYQNKTPYRFDLIKKVTSLGCTEAQFRKVVEHLVAARFLAIEPAQLASSVLAARYQDATEDAKSRYHAASPEGESEKRREETEAEGESDARARDPPSGLDISAWETWTRYRTQIRKPLKPASIPAAQRSLAAFGSDQAKVVDQSIGNGWQGLFDLKITNGSGKHKVRVKSVAELDAEEAANVEH